HDSAGETENSSTAPIHAAPACLQKSLFRQAEGLRIPKAAPLVADRSRVRSTNPTIFREERKNTCKQSKSMLYWKKLNKKTKIRFEKLYAE
ncbi:MAG: hypothetical protein ACI4I5_00910, partial [Acutalibacteraceae bacterium]